MMRSNAIKNVIKSLLPKRVKMPEIEIAPGVSIPIHRPSEGVSFDFACDSYIDYGDIRIMKGEKALMETSFGKRLVTYDGIHMNTTTHIWYPLWITQDDTYPTGLCDILGITKYPTVLIRTAYEVSSKSLSE